MGFSTTIARPEASIEVAPGSTVVLCSDGLIEWRGEILDIGLARLAGVVNGLIGHHVDDLPTALIDAMADHNEADDDIVAVVVRFVSERPVPTDAGIATLGA